MLEVIKENIASGLERPHDHGSKYISTDFQDEISFPGIEVSSAFVRAPEGNGCVKRAIHTLKEQLLCVQKFATIEELRIALLQWADLYNEQWLIRRHGFEAPAQRPREYYGENEKLAA